jgi:hypothetical protein
VDIKMAHWERLPPEIRLIILGTLLLGRNPGSGIMGDYRNSNLACYASVSKEWQAAFEKRNFHRLTLSPSCLKDLDRIVRRRRGFVKHICLRIQKKTTMDRNDENNRKAIRKLFTVLNTWGTEGDWSSNSGLTMELSFHGRNGSSRAFKDSHFPYSESIDEYHHSDFYDLCYWVNGHDQYLGPSSIVTAQVAASKFDIDLVFTRKLPKVDIVTRFLVHRQPHRKLTWQTLSQIFSSLPRLEYIHCEPSTAIAPIEEGIDFGMFL